MRPQEAGSVGRETCGGSRKRGLWWCEHSRLVMVKDGGSCVFASGLLVASYRCKKGGIHAVLQGGGEGMLGK